MPSLLLRVECTSTARSAWSKCSMATSGDSSAAAARGSSDCGGAVSFATSSDWTTTRRGVSTGSTTYSIAATDRCTNETSRVEVTRTFVPAAEHHSTRRCSIPARRPSSPSGATVQHPRARVGLALVREEPPVAQVERLVVHEQADELAVRDVDDRLAGL